MLLLGPSSFPARQQVSDDRDLKEVDLKNWPCLSRAEGSAKTPDGAERNRLKNRALPADMSHLDAKNFDSVGFLRNIADFDAMAKGKRRKDLTFPEKEKLAPLEQQLVQLTGYLVLAYCGPPETTNCGSGDMHDWHLEVFEKPMDHQPSPGDPTPLICEITPRTQNAIYHDGIRLQELAAFFRHPDMTYEATGHKARKVRFTGYLMWDDEHNGSADVGTAIRTVNPANKYHNPWRSAAWEIHPVIKVEPLEGVIAKPTDHASPAPSAAASETTPAASPAEPGASPPNESIPAPSATMSPTPTATVVAQQIVTITQPVKLAIPYGETILARGTKLPISAHDARTVTIKYMGTPYNIPISSTDFQP